MFFIRKEEQELASDAGPPYLLPPPPPPLFFASRLRAAPAGGRGGVSARLSAMRRRNGPASPAMCPPVAQSMYPCCPGPAAPKSSVCKRALRSGPLCPVSKHARAPLSPPPSPKPRPASRTTPYLQMSKLSAPLQAIVREIHVLESVGKKVVHKL